MPTTRYNVPACCTRLCTRPTIKIIAINLFRGVFPYFPSIPSFYLFFYSLLPFLSFSLPFRRDGCLNSFRGLWSAPIPTAGFGAKHRPQTHFCVVRAKKTSLVAVNVVLFMLNKIRKLTFMLFLNSISGCLILKIFTKYSLAIIGIPGYAHGLQWTVQRCRCSCDCVPCSLLLLLSLLLLYDFHRRSSCCKFDKTFRNKAT